MMPDFLRNQRGFTLVELMVSMVLGLLLMSGVVQIFLANKTTYQMQTQLEGIQENARYAVQQLTKDLRMVGYGGCGAGTKVANSIEDPDAHGLQFELGIVGYHADDSTSPVLADGPAPETYPSRISGAFAFSVYPETVRLNAIKGTDAFIIHKANDGDGLAVTSHNPESAVIHFNETHEFLPGTVMVLASADCSQIGVFANSGPTNSNGTASTIVHNIGSSDVKNCTVYLGGTFTCATYEDDASAVEYPPGSTVMAMESATYYIGVSGIDVNIPALYRVVVNSSEPEEVVAGVEGMKVHFGLDSNGDGLAERYLLATEVDKDSWILVVSVRVKIAMRSHHKFEGDYLRKSFTTTVQIRNRG